MSRNDFNDDAKDDKVGGFITEQNECLINLNPNLKNRSGGLTIINKKTGKAWKMTKKNYSCALASVSLKEYFYLVVELSKMFYL